MIFFFFFVAIGYRKIEPPDTVMAAEMQAITDGIEYEKGHFYGPLRVLSDSLEAMHSIHNDSMYKGVEELHIQAVKKLISDYSVKGV